MLHNTLQVHATQMAPEARGGALALFACSLFTGQSAGVWLASHVVDAAGARPVFASRRSACSRWRSTSGDGWLDCALQ